jgi:hypothetical protein
MLLSQETMSLFITGGTRELLELNLSISKVGLERVAAKVNGAKLEESVLGPSAAHAA